MGDLGDRDGLTARGAGPRLTRRQLLLGVGAALALPRGSWGAQPRGLDVGMLALGEGTTLRPGAWERLLYEVEIATSVEVARQAVAVRPEDPELFRHPLLTLTGDGSFGLPSAEGLEQLSRFLSFGGLLLADGAGDGGGFDASVRALSQALFPTRPLSPLSPDHSLYRSFFLVERPVGRLGGERWLEGVMVGNLTPLIHSRVDLAGALEAGPGGALAPCVPGGEAQRREAIKLGVNAVMYALTANYKRDQIHVQELMREGKL